MFQQIDPYVFDNHFEPLSASDGDLGLLVRGHEAFVLEKEGEICLPLCGNIVTEKWIYLFAVSGTRIFLARSASETVLPEGRWLGYRDLFGRRPAWLFYAVMMGIQIDTFSASIRTASS